MFGKLDLSFLPVLHVILRFNMNHQICSVVFLFALIYLQIPHTSGHTKCDENRYSGPVFFFCFLVYPRFTHAHKEKTKACTHTRIYLCTRMSVCKRFPCCARIHTKTRHDTTCMQIYIHSKMASLLVYTMCVRAFVFGCSCEIFSLCMK